MRARPFFALIATAAVIALACGLAAATPRPAPVYALQSGIVYHAEVALAVFAAIYLAAICIRLAWHGRTLTRIGSSVDVPEVAAVNDDLDATRAELCKLTARLRLVSPSEHDDPIDLL